MFFETHYNILTSGEPSPRSLRLRDLESGLREDLTISVAEKDDKRRAWARQETNHLRQTRVMKVRSANALRGAVVTDSKYEVIKVFSMTHFTLPALILSIRY